MTARGTKVLVKAGFLAYCLLMLWLLFGQRLRWGAGDYSWNLKPLDTVGRYLWVLSHSTDPALLWHAVVNLAGNVVMFVPLGFFTPVLWPPLRKCGWHLLCMLLIIVLVELGQLITRLGSCDVDDLLLNLIGTALGFLGWKCLHGIRKMRSAG